MPRNSCIFFALMNRLHRGWINCRTDPCIHQLTTKGWIHQGMNQLGWIHQGMNPLGMNQLGINPLGWSRVESTNGYINWGWFYRGWMHQGMNQLDMNLPKGLINRGWIHQGLNPPMDKSTGMISLGLNAPRKGDESTRRRINWGCFYRRDYPLGINQLRINQLGMNPSRVESTNG